MRDIIWLADFGKVWLSVKDPNSQSRFLLLNDEENFPYSCVPELGLRLRNVCEDRYLRRVAITRGGSSVFVLVVFLNGYFSAPTFKFFDMSNQMIYDISTIVVGTFLRQGYVGTADGSIRLTYTGIRTSDEIPVEIGIALELYRKAYLES